MVIYRAIGIQGCQGFGHAMLPSQAKPLFWEEQRVEAFGVREDVPPDGFRCCGAESWSDSRSPWR